MEWFSVDKEGLAQLMARKGKGFIINELVQNAWDENTTLVQVSIDRMPGSPFVSINVRDDNPTGFANLSHAFTLFAKSNKKGNAEKRGRFNLGEKLVLAMCEEAAIASTTGTVWFTPKGRTQTNVCTKRGSEFIGKIRMTEAEVKEAEYCFRMLIAPQGICTTLTINGGEEYELLRQRPVSVMEESLPTEIADDQGNMRRTSRNTEIEIYQALMHGAYIYEMGIPVVSIDGPFDINVMQKVPLNFDRDNVTPAYLARVYALIAENRAKHLGSDDVNATWVKTAMQENPDLLSDATVNTIMDLRFGDKRVAYDPSDPEANARAVVEGYQVVHGGTMSKTEWDTVKRAEAIQPAGRLFPTNPETFVAANEIPEEDWTLGMRRVARYAQFLAKEALGFDIKVRIINSAASQLASYGSRQITFNLRHLGHNWFDGILENITDLVIHELAHEYASNHLSTEYYHACTKVGAKFTMLAMQNPASFENFTLRAFREADRVNMLGRRNG